jgi:hypothetical protein
MDYHIRSKELGLASKEEVKALVESHNQSGKSNKPLFLDVRSDAEIQEAQLPPSFSVGHIPCTATDTSALERNIHVLFPMKQGRNVWPSTIFKTNPMSIF